VALPVLVGVDAADVASVLLLRGELLPPPQATKPTAPAQAATTNAARTKNSLMRRL
jgi:hypothetical protein